MGPKAAEMLRLIPAADGKAPDVKVIERCSGHGGSWGVMKENYEVALKVGKPVATQALKQAKAFVASECPLAGSHIAQGIERLGKDGGPATPPEFETLHPIEIFARAYGLAG
jgi:glycerol-3-phosphate dehydrogenase subunit C